MGVTLAEQLDEVVSERAVGIGLGLLRSFGGHVRLPPVQQEHHRCDHAEQKGILPTAGRGVDHTPMQVFVTGATGYVGWSVATAFRRAGHRVWGLTRTEAKAPRLAQQEIEPIVGELGGPKTYADVAAEWAALVHAAFEYSANGVAKDKKAIEALIETGRRGARPKTLIFTSGAWVHGDTGDRMVDETTPLNPVKLAAWRPAHEQLVLQASGVRGLVIRPGCVYGGPSGLTAPWFADASAGKAPAVVGDGRNRWTMVHADDLADAYLRAGESGLGGEVFDISDRSRATVLEMAT